MCQQFRNSIENHLKKRSKKTNFFQDSKKLISKRLFCFCLAISTNKKKSYPNATCKIPYLEFGPALHVMHDIKYIKFIL